MLDGIWSSLITWEDVMVYHDDWWGGWWLLFSLSWLVTMITKHHVYSCLVLFCFVFTGKREDVKTDVKRNSQTSSYTPDNSPKIIKQHYWLVVSNIFHFPCHIWDSPSHWLSYFSKCLKPPTRLSISQLYLTGWCFGTFIFPYIGNFIIPTDELIFFRGVGIPPTSYPLVMSK